MHNKDKINNTKIQSLTLAFVILMQAITIRLKYIVNSC